MDRILSIARRRDLKVIEDCSHAHGALYKGRLVGTFGDVAAFSLMSGKSFAIGEGGMLLTNDRAAYERAIAFGHYERHGDLTLDDLVSGAGLPLGGYKYRMHQLSSAVGRVQLTKYPTEMAEIDRAMTRFGDLLEDVPGIHAHRPPRDSGLTMGGWYAPIGLYQPEALGGLSVRRFCEALTAEGVPSRPGVNKALHLHPLFNEIDVYGDGLPTRLANLPEGVDVRQPPGSLPVSEGVQERVFSVPWFKHDRPEIIHAYATAIRKVADRHQELLEGDPGNLPNSGKWATSRLTGPASG